MKKKKVMEKSADSPRLSSQSVNFCSFVETSRISPL